MKNDKDQEQLIADNFYEYIRTKAQRYINIGLDEYQKNDAFDQPSGYLSKEDLEKLINGCKQVLQYQGMTPETAFENLEITGFYKLMELFHFEVVKQRTVKMKDDGHIVDEMHLVHIMSGQTMILFNRVQSNQS